MLIYLEKGKYCCHEFLSIIFVSVFKTDLIMTLVTVKTFDNSMDAHLLKSRIESEGVRCFLFDDETVTMNPLFAQAIGGIKLKVNQRDLFCCKRNTTRYF